MVRRLNESIKENKQPNNITLDEIMKYKRKANSLYKELTQSLTKLESDMDRFDTSASFDSIENRGKYLKAYNDLTGALQRCISIIKPVDLYGTLYNTESVNKKSVKEDVQSDWLDNITFVMYKYVQSKMYGIKIVEDTKDGNFKVSYEGVIVDMSFDITEDGYYVYTIDDDGPYSHHSYEYIQGDIMQYVDSVYGVENDDEE